MTKKDLIGNLALYCCSGTMHVCTQPFFPYVVISNCKMSSYKVINLHYLTILTNTLDKTRFLQGSEFNTKTSKMS